MGVVVMEPPLKKDEFCCIDISYNERQGEEVWKGPYLYVRPHHVVKTIIGEHFHLCDKVRRLTPQEFRYLEGQFDDSNHDDTAKAHPAWVRGYRFCNQLWRQERC